MVVMFMIFYLRSIDYGNVLEIVRSNGIQYVEEKRAVSFLNDWCLLYGSTYEGRRAACKLHLQIQQKVPILISEYTGDLMFPTRNVRSYDCIWINYRAVESCKGNANACTITFLDDEKLMLDCDVRMLKRELTLCRKYLELIRSSPR